MKITRNMLLIAAPFAGKRDVRHYLNGIMVEATAHGKLRAVATDGHALMATLDEASEAGEPSGQWIIPNDAVTWMLKTKADAVEVTQTQDGWRADANGQSLAFQMIDGRFPPAWRDCIPGVPESPELIGFMDSEIVGKLHKAFGKIRNGKPASVRLVGIGLYRVVRVLVGELPHGLSATGCIMPLRSDKVVCDADRALAEQVED